MCGLSGLVHRNSSEVNRPLLSEMTEALRHRGPDAGNIYCDKNVGLGHRRLSIIDIEGGSQPMSLKDESVTVVFNGEIYNYQDLKKDLTLKGHNFETNCDTEVLRKG